MKTLADALPKEIERVIEIIPVYESVGLAGAFAVAMMKQSIKMAEQAILNGDTVGMVESLSDLRGYEL